MVLKTWLAVFARRPWIKIQWSISQKVVSLRSVVSVNFNQSKALKSHLRLICDYAYLDQYSSYILRKHTPPTNVKGDILIFIFKYVSISYIIMLSVNFFCNINSYDIFAYITKNYIALIYHAKIVHLLCQFHAGKVVFSAVCQAIYSQFTCKGADPICQSIIVV